MIVLPFVAAVLIAVGQTAAQSPAGNDLAQQADAAFQAHRWAEAEVAYTKLAEEGPKSARVEYRLGIAARGTGHYEVALTAFDNAEKLAPPGALPSFVLDYERAATRAAMGDKERALALLKQAADAGYLQTQRIDNDVEWTSLRKDTEFVALSDEVHRNAAPCESAEFHQFDFWLGDWDVAGTRCGQGGGHEPY